MGVGEEGGVNPTDQFDSPTSAVQDAATYVSFPPPLASTTQASFLITSASPEPELHLQRVCGSQEAQMREACTGPTCVGQIGTKPAVRGAVVLTSSARAPYFFF